MPDAERAYGKVIEYIKSQIAAGVYTVGDKLPPERTLAETLGVSRNSVREAMRVLDILGVITSQQGAGNYLSANTENTSIEVMTLMYLLQRTTYRDIADYRYALELQAMSLAMQHATEEQLQTMEHCVGRMEQISEGSEKVIMEKRIHYTIAEASGNSLIYSNLIALSEVMDKFIVDMRARILTDPENKGRLQNSHRELVAAIREKNFNKGRAALEEHFSCIYENLNEEPNDIRQNQ